MRRHLVGGLLVSAGLVAGPATADVRITVANGQVSVSATDATVRQILTEWARVGQTRIVNVDGVGGAPITIELVNVPEAQALDVILRSVSGYVAAPRAVAVPNASLYDRILLLPTSTPAAAVAPPAARPGARPAPGAPVFQPPPPVVDDQQPDENEARPGAPQPGAPGRPPFNTFQPPPPQREAPEQPPAPASYPAPTAPVGVAVPGMPVPTPQQPGQAQPGQAQPGQPRR